MATTETRQVKQTDNKFMCMLRIATNRQLSGGEMLMAKQRGLLPEGFPDIFTGNRSRECAYFTTDNGYASVVQDYRWMLTRDVSDSKKTHTGYYMVRQEVRAYTPEGRLTSRNIIKNSSGILISPVGSSYEIRVEYNPPGRLWGRTAFKRGH